MPRHFKMARRFKTNQKRSIIWFGQYLLRMKYKFARDLGCFWSKAPHDVAILGAGLKGSKRQSCMIFKIKIGVSAKRLRFQLYGKYPVKPKMAHLTITPNVLCDKVSPHAQQQSVGFDQSAALILPDAYGIDH